MLEKLKRRRLVCVAIASLFLISLVANWGQTGQFLATIALWLLAAGYVLYRGRKKDAELTGQEEGTEVAGYQQVSPVSTDDDQQILFRWDGLTISELENLSDDELVMRFRAWTERASLLSNPTPHAFLVGSRLSILDSAVLNCTILKWSQNQDHLSLEPCSEFLLGYWNTNGPLDLRVVKSLFDYACSKPIHHSDWRPAVVSALAAAYKRGARTEGLKELLQRCVLAFRESQPGFTELLAESLASDHPNDRIREPIR